MTRVLSNRTDSTQAKPSRRRRVVVAPDGALYASLMAAAAVYGVWPASISMRATLRRDGWRDATPEEIATLVLGG